MKIDLTDQIGISPALPLRRVAVFNSSALPLELVGIPDSFGNAQLVGLTVSVVNADGVPISAPAAKHGSEWRVAFAPSCFPTYGFVERGFRATATIREDGADHAFILAVGDLDVLRYSPSAQPGDPARALQGKADDIYVKTHFSGGVQHFAKQSVVFNARLNAYAAEWTGDYILVGDEFVEVTI